MTRKQAKSELMQIYGMLSEEKKQALDVLMAQADGDLISRQAALGCCRNEWEEEVEIRLKSLPPVNPTKTGHWIWEVSSHKCSACNEYTCFEDSKPPKYCPNCGAKMVEPQEI